MSEEMMIPNTPQVHLVARNPVEMQNTQSLMKAWLDNKLAGIEDEIRELNAALNEARQNGWATTALTRQRNKTVAQETFYFKILKAVESGYTIIPDFPIDVFAIRVTRNRVTQPRVISHQSYGHPALPDEQPDAARVGEGEYKNPSQIIRHGEYKERQGDKEVTVKYTAPTGFQDEIVFPIQAARPQVMSAAAEAMALKVFDQLGICLPIRNEQRWRGKGDPIIIGQILGQRAGYTQKCVSFIIAWHLNLNEL